jgi:hypothetical protein
VPQVDDVFFQNDFHLPSPNFSPVPVPSACVCRTAKGGGGCIPFLLGKVWFSHPVFPQRLKPRLFASRYGRAEACPHLLDLSPSKQGLDQGPC